MKSFLSFLLAKFSVCDDVVPVRILVPEFSQEFRLPQSKLLRNWHQSFFSHPFFIQLETCIAHWNLSRSCLLFFFWLVKNRRFVLRMIDSYYSMRMSRIYLRFHSFNRVPMFLRLLRLVSRS